MKPINFCVLFWGQHFRTHYFELWLRSMLQPGNFPQLRASEGHKLIIACPTHDWAMLPLDALKPYITPIHFEIPYPGEDQGHIANLVHQNRWLIKLLTFAHQPGTYTSLYCPDTIMSDGTVRFLLDCASSGAEAVIYVGLHQSEGSFLADRQGPLQRQFVRHLHPEMLAYVWPQHRELTHSPFFFFRSGDNLHVRSFTGVPGLVDNDVALNHWAAGINSRAMPGDHDMSLRTNVFEPCKKIVFAQPDDICCVSLKSERMLECVPKLPASKPASLIDRLMNIRSAYACHVIDHVRKQMFLTSFNFGYPQQNAKADTLIWLAVGDYIRHDRPAGLRKLVFDLIPRWTRFPREVWRYKILRSAA